MLVNLVTGSVFRLDLSLFFASLSKSICPVAQLAKNLPAMWETWVQSLG